jgi:hypothetical protein
VAEQSPQQAGTTVVSWPAEPPASKSDMQRDADPFPLLPSRLAMLDR